MVRNLKKRLGVVATTTIVVVAATIYFKDGTIFQDFVNGSFKFFDGILFGNKHTKANHWSKLDKTLATLSQSKDLNRILNLFKRMLKMIHKPTIFDN